LDVNTIYSNDINVMLNCYGVEAANRTIVKVLIFKNKFKELKKMVH